MNEYCILVLYLGKNHQSAKGSEKQFFVNGLEENKWADNLHLFKNICRGDFLRYR